MEAVLTQAINRLEAALIGEGMALRDGHHARLGEIGNRKNQSLLELSRIARGLDREGLSEEARERLGSLRAHLVDNSRLIQLHMDATAEISDIITQAMAEAESDGTYGSSIQGVKHPK